MHKTICIDTETTGIRTGVDEILTLSIADARDRSPVYQKAFCPGHIKSWPEAEQVHGISPKSVATCPRISNCIEEIQSIFNAANTVMAYNAQFDLKFLEAAGIHIPADIVIIDPMIEFSNLMRIPVHNGRKGYKWFKLSEAARIIGYNWESGKAHDSMCDALATIAVHNWCKNHSRSRY